MKNIVWFGNMSDKTSFSRVSESFLKCLSRHFNIFILTNANVDKKKYPEYKITKLSEDTSEISYEEFLYSWNINRTLTPENKLECMIKYSILQLKDIVDNNDISYVLICNGLNETKYVVSVIHETSCILMSKIIAWVPIDYIPDYKSMKELLYCKYLFTMNPVMSDILKKLNEDNDASEVIIDWVPHGSDIEGSAYGTSGAKGADSSAGACGTSDGTSGSTSSTSPYRYIMAHKDLWFSNNDFTSDSIIILNANNCVPRKRLDLTIALFKDLKRKLPKKESKKVKLWLHTNIQELYSSGICTEGLGPDVILSNNNASDEFLRMLYKLCQIGLQTSMGEGFSLTNFEHTYYNPKSIQIVPDFLATGYFFKDNRGILMEVTQHTSVDTVGQGPGAGTVSEIIYDKALQTLEHIVLNYDKIVLDDMIHWTWESACDKFVSLIDIN